MLSTRKQFSGTVSSDSRDKTITVVVETYVAHPIYHKRFKKLKKFHVHDEKNAAKKGDLVSFEAVRPISKTKSFRLLKVLQVAKGGH